MPRVARELSALHVKRLTDPGLHAVGGVKGLCLQVVDGDARSWILRVLINGKRRSVGLGGYPDVSLSEARERASALRMRIRNGVDPVEERRALRALSKAKQNAMTFEKAARLWHASKRHEYKNEKHAAQVLSSMEAYAFGQIGSPPVSDVAVEHVRNVLQPIWVEKTETASRLRGRLESVLAWATVSGHRSGENPARWKRNLDALLAAPGKVARVKHHAALPVQAMPAFFAQLNHMNGIAARALQFLILTAARSGEVRGGTWDEISADGLIWRIPASRMKAGREHRVPLTTEARAILDDLPRVEGCPFIFAASRGGMLSDMSISAVMRRMKHTAVPHGFRSTFRDWVAEHTQYPGELAEMALAHAIANKVEAAYRRGDLLDKRREMMAEWSALCTSSLDAFAPS